MQIKVKKIESAKVSIILSLVLAAMSLLFYPYILITYNSSNSMGQPMMSAIKYLYLLFPIFYFVLGFIGTYIFCVILNLILKWTNGFCVEIDGEWINGDSGEYYRKETIGISEDIDGEILEKD
ncbi:hypothetical protein ACFLYJ_02565 [Candidatus Cloacimonadota bacterium]